MLKGPFTLSILKRRFLRYFNDRFILLKRRSTRERMHDARKKKEKVI